MSIGEFAGVDYGPGSILLAPSAVAATEGGDVAVGLTLAVAGALIATGLQTAFGAIAARRRWTMRVPELDLSFFSISNLALLTAWLGLYGVRVGRELLGASTAFPSRTTIGTLIVVHYMLSGIDRRRRRMNAYSVTGPWVAAATAVVFTFSRGSVWGTLGAFVAGCLYFIGYYRAEDCYGKFKFGLTMFSFAMLGAVLMALGFVRVGEVLLVFAGITAGARSITAFVKNLEDRKPPRPEEAPPVAPPATAT